jgi:hypothetical protein
MPEGWSFNPWALTPWGVDPVRDAARDTAQMGGGQAAPSLADVLQPPVPVRDPDDYDPADWFAHVSRDWPTVPNVILAENQVMRRDLETVLGWVNRSLAQDEERTSLQCFHYAKYQMHVAGFGISGPPAIDGDSILVIREYRRRDGGTVPELQLPAAVRAVTYIRDSLVAGIPVMIGVKITGYEEEPNNIWGTPYVIATDHFVVAVGLGIEDGKPYVNIYDYLNAYRGSDRLFLTPVMILESERIGYRMIEMRRSSPR